MKTTTIPLDVDVELDLYERGPDDVSVTADVQITFPLTMPREAIGPNRNRVRPFVIGGIVTVVVSLETGKWSPAEFSDGLRKALGDLGARADDVIRKAIADEVDDDKCRAALEEED